MAIPALAAPVTWPSPDDGLPLGGPPPNDQCSGAVIVPLEDGTTVSRSGDNTGATDEFGFGAGQAWEGFSITACMDVTIDYCGTAPVFQGVFSFLGVGCPINNFAVTGGELIDQSTCADNNYTLRYPELPPGTYYFPVLTAPGSTGPYTVTFSATACTAVPPANDECANATTLTPALSCEPLTGDVSGANNGVSLPAIPCAGFLGNASDDVWFSFVATSTEHTIVAQGSAQFDPTVDLRSGACGATTTIACSDNTGRGGVETLNATGLTVGETYFVRINDWYGGVPLTTTFTLCVIGPSPDDCLTDAGALAGGGIACLEDGSTTLSATPDGNAVVPSGYETVYVLTEGPGLVITAVNAAPEFTVNVEGNYTIHTLVYDPATLHLGIVEIGVTNGFDVNALLQQGGGSICGSLDVAGAAFEVLADCSGICLADAGTLAPLTATLCLEDGQAFLLAEATEPPTVPDGFQVLYVLTQGPELVIINAEIAPFFGVDEAGSYTIHTLVYDPTTLDLSTVVIGETTGFDVNALLIQGGGAICASLDVAGAAFVVEDCTPPCDAGAGTLSGGGVACLEDGSATLTATADGNAVVPAGYETVFVLTEGAGLVIIDAGAVPEFSVNAEGSYTIHTLVYDPATLDLNIVEPGVTTGFDVNALLIQGGGDICASLDVAGAAFTVEVCTEPCDADAGTLSGGGTVCLEDGSATLTATADGNAVVPAGYETVYVLTEGAGLVIIDAGAAPEFSVNAEGSYTIHTLVYDPATLDLSIVEPGVTTGFDVNGLLIQGGGDICASLDVAGAAFTVEECTPANNACTDAIALPVGSSCIPVTGDNSFATQTGGTPECDFTTVSFADVWYTFNAGANTEVEILLTPGTTTDWGITVADACDGEELLCEVQPEGPLVLSTTPGADYIIRVYSNLQFGEGGTFDLCVTGEFPSIVCDGGTVTTDAGSTLENVCQDALADVLAFTSTSTSDQNYRFIVTNEDGVILTPLAGNALDFNGAPLGGYRVWGVSFNGTLLGATPGANIADITSTGECLELSTDFVTVNVEICTGLSAWDAGQWSLFPNPGNGDITLVPAITDPKVVVQVLDMAGRLVHDEQLSVTAGQAHGIALSGRVVPGAYTVRLTSASGSAALRLVVH